MAHVLVMFRLRPILFLLFLSMLVSSCATVNKRFLPPGGRLVAETRGEYGRLRIYTLPPAQTPILGNTYLVYVELHNLSRRSLRVDYRDLAMGEGGGKLLALRPGDVLRPARLTVGQRRLYASLQPGVLFGRQLSLEPPRRPDTMAEWESDRSVPDIVWPTSRSKPNSLWIMRNDYNTGMQLSSAGFRSFGLPLPGTSISLFDLLVMTLPDGALLPGATLSGFLFFPEPSRLLAKSGIHWQVHDAVTDEALEILALPVEAR